MTDEPVGGRENIVQTDAEADLLDDFVGVLEVDVVFDGYLGVLVEVFGFDLDQVRDFGLKELSDMSCWDTGREIY